MSHFWIEWAAFKLYDVFGLRCKIQIFFPCAHMYEGATPHNWDFFLEGRPLVVQASPAKWLYQCTSLFCCERLCLASVNFFFLKTHSRHLPIWWRVIYKGTCPYHTECSAVFAPKWHDPCALPSLVTLSRSQVTFFVVVFPDEKSPQREMFYWCGRGETKNQQKH